MPIQRSGRRSWWSVKAELKRDDDDKENSGSLVAIAREECASDSEAFAWSICFHPLELLRGSGTIDHANGLLTAGLSPCELQGQLFGVCCLLLRMSYRATLTPA